MVIAVRTERRSGGLEVVKHADADAEQLRLQREAELLARSAHPGVVEVVDVGLGTLRLRHAGTALAQLGPLAPDHAAAVVRRVASTVGDLHRIGVAHRRLTADHIVVDAEGRPRLCGFAEAGDADDAATADDVAALGELLADLLDAASGALWSPALRGIRAAPRRTRALRGFRAAIASATHRMPERRPSAAQFAAALHTALPELTLPSGAGLPAAPRADADSPTASEIPAEIEPTDDLAWTDADLTFLAAPDDAAPDDGDADRTARPAPEHTPSSPESGRLPTSAQDAALRIEIRPPATTDTATPTGPSRALVAAVAAAVLIGGVVAGAVIAREIRPFGGAEAASGATSGEPSVDDSTADPAGELDPDRQPPAFPDECDVPPAPGPDVDDDGCPDAVTLDGRVATVGSVAVELGVDGDLVALGDPDCDGVVTPGLLRPETGEVFVFDRWSLTEPLEVDASLVVEDAAAIAGASCEPFTVTDASGATVAVGEAGR